MAGLAEALPVRAIPEQFLIAAMRRYVVDFSAGSDSTLLFANDAERMLHQPGLGGFTPAMAVTALASATAPLIKLTLTLAFRVLMSIAVARS